MSNLIIQTEETTAIVETVTEFDPITNNTTVTTTTLYLAQLEQNAHLLDTHFESEGGVGFAKRDLGGGKFFLDAKGTTGGDDVINIRYAIHNSYSGQKRGGENHVRSHGGDDIIIGDSGDSKGNVNCLFGGLGSDLIIGGNKVDILYGNDLPHRADISAEDGSDTIYGLGGRDLIRGGAGGDFLYGGDGHDRIYGDAGNDFIDGGAGNDMMDGGDGIDTVSYASSTDPVTESLDNSLPGNLLETNGRGAFRDFIGPNRNDNIANDDELYNFENLIGSNYGDTLTGDANDNEICGLAGDDTINGGLGNDILEGGAGADILDGGDSDTSIGSDTASYVNSLEGVCVSLMPNAIMGKGGDAEGDTFKGIDNLIGSAYDDTLMGDNTDNVLNGGIGGEDKFLGGTGSDTVSYEDFMGSVEVYLHNSNLNKGGAENDILIRIENLIGTDWSDVLSDNRMANHLQGGTGSDQYHFRPDAMGVVDRITDVQEVGMQNAIYFFSDASHDYGSYSFVYSPSTSDSGRTDLTIRVVDMNSNPMSPSTVNEVMIKDYSTGLNQNTVNHFTIYHVPNGSMGIDDAVLVDTTF